MAFKDKEEFYKLIGMMVEKINNDKPLYDKLASANLTCTLQITNMDSTIVTVSAKNAKLEFEYGEPIIKPEATVLGTDEIFAKFWQGKVNLLTAMATGKLKVGGAVASITKLLPRLSGCYPKWVEVLKEAGREDLIVK